MTIKIRFYDDMTILNERYKICDKLNELLKEYSDSNNYNFSTEFYCLSNGVLKNCIVQNDGVIFNDIDMQSHFIIGDDEFCYILVDLDWKNHSNIRDKVLSEYNNEFNREKIKMLLYTHAAAYTDLSSDYEIMRKTYNYFQFFKTPTFIYHNELFINNWCESAAEVFKT